MRIGTIGNHSFFSVRIPALLLPFYLMFILMYVCIQLCVIIFVGFIQCVVLITRGVAKITADAIESHRRNKQAKYDEWRNRW